MVDFIAKVKETMLFQDIEEFIGNQDVNY